MNPAEKFLEAESARLPDHTPQALLPCQKGRYSTEEQMRREKKVGVLLVLHLSRVPQEVLCSPAMCLGGDAQPVVGCSRAVLERDTS